MWCGYVGVVYDSTFRFDELLLGCFGWLFVEVYGLMLVCCFIV